MSPRILAPMLTMSVMLAAQPQAKFEVASIRPAQDASSHGIKIDSARVEIGGWSVKQLILRAYGLQPYQLSGPEWLDSVFDVLAKYPEGATQDQLPEMLQSLLAERFGLVTHRETRQLEGFALLVAKGGPKMKPAPPEADDRATNILDTLWGTDYKAFGLTAFSSANGELHMEFTKIPMAALVQILASYLRAPLIDMTGLQGRYQAALDISFDPGDTSLFSTVNRLGLRLERRKSAFEVLIVDHLKRIPTEN